MHWIYIYKCWDCGMTMTRYFKARKPSPYVACVACGEPVEQDYTQKNVRVDVFEPYVESNFSGSPVEIGSRRERDALCSQNDATYDSNRYPRKPQRKRWEKDLTWDKVKNMAGNPEAVAAEQLLANKHVEDLP